MKRNNLETSFEMIVNSFNNGEAKVSKDHRNDFYMMGYNDFEPSHRKHTREDKSNSVGRRMSVRFLDEDDGVEQLKSIESKCYFTIDKKIYAAVAKIEQFHLKFIFEKNIQVKMPYKMEYYNIAFNTIAKIDKTSFSQGNYELEITTKEYRTYTIKIPSNNYYFANSLEDATFPTKVSKHFAYAYWFYDQQKSNCLTNIKRINGESDKIPNGWDRYCIEDEFSRQQIDFKNKKSSRYKLLDNSNFTYCATYPSKIIVPSCIKDNDITLCASFRTKGRLPALTYQYKNKRCIWRSSQSKGGLTFQKCEQDVNLITKITDLGKKLMLYDARPYLNAFANVFKGAGYENINHYPKIKMEVKFCDLNNIHAVKTSLHKLSNAIQACTNDPKKFLSNIENSLWYDYISLLIKSSSDICNSIKDDCTVLVHCSDGWDRTTQLCATSQLIIDPYYRTLAGFVVLIEKDWLSFGHQFALRNWNYAQKQNSEDQSSPIFIQWLDAVYQLMIQNFSLFEFNTDLLTFLANELYIGKYGTFLFNSEKDRKTHEAKSKTVSIWTYVFDNKTLFINPFYNKDENNQCEELDFQFKKIRLWEEFLFKEDFKSLATITRQKIEMIDEKSKEIEEYKKALKDIKLLLVSKHKDSIPKALNIISNTIGDSCESFVVINEISTSNSEINPSNHKYQQKKNDNSAITITNNESPGNMNIIDSFH